MAKRPSSPNAGHPPKRSHKLAGFRVARPPPSGSQHSSSSNSSLFITVKPHERCGILNTQTRVFSSTPDPSTSPSISTNDPEPEVEQYDSVDLGADTGPTPEPEPDKPKRKRKTKNAVRNSSNIFYLLHSDLPLASTHRMAQIQKHLFRRSPSTRRTWRFSGPYRMFKVSKSTWNY